MKRYFVSPEESGQICMLAAMLGDNREIFFPKLEEAQMMTFDAIAVELLKAYGYEPKLCGSDEEAIAYAKEHLCGGVSGTERLYPVHFSKSDTSGEKPYEEFYTDGESVDEGRFDSLGVITGKGIPDRKAVDALIRELDSAFERTAVAKEDIVSIISSYLPDFEHIETGRSLDGKM